MILSQTVHEIYSSESVGFVIFARFWNFNNRQLEVVSDVISSTAYQDVGMDVCASFGDSGLKLSEASFSAFFSSVDNFRPEVGSDVISSVVVEPTGMKVHVKLG